MRRIRIDVAYHEFGYDVEVVDVETETALDTYEAGNCQGESTQRVSRSHPLCLSLDQIARNALQTLYETINEHSSQEGEIIVAVSMRQGENDTDGD